MEGPGNNTQLNPRDKEAITKLRGSSGGPVAKTLGAQCRRPRFDLWSGN